MALSSGDKLGHFEVVAAIGQGGMGEVYQARDTRLDRTVAIKVIHGLVASDPALRERFQREARAVSSLNHPHICTLHDVGSEGDVDFLVMEHLEGESLADRLKRGALSFEEALRYGIQIADALDAAHPVRTGSQFEPSWSPDGTRLVLYEMHPSTGRDIWMLPLGGEPVPLAATAASERSPRVSPNGRWLAYASDESGRDEVLVQAFPGPGNKHVISTDGGREPVWSPDGTELFYRRGDELLVVDVGTGDELDAGTPRTLLTARFVVGAGGRNQNYDVSPDGERFVFVQRDEGVPRELRVVQNWFEELERLVPSP